MTRDEKLRALAEVLMMAADKARTLSETGAADGAMTHEADLAMRLVGMAQEFRDLAGAFIEGAPA